tara:strand:- start:140 stop:595 length:456 start_codon:yes stop_codon:yes gene_type:complete
MKNTTLNLILCGILTLILSSCGKNTDKKANIVIETQTELEMDTGSESESDFVFSKGNKKVELILEHGVKFLEVGKPTRADFPTENINDQRFMISGPGIMVNTKSRNEFRFTITPIESTLVNGNLEINVTESVENGENFTHKFLVPVKTKME